MVLFWHRRDLRIEDNAGLYKALQLGTEVQPVFIFDTTILDELPKKDQRVLFIHQEIGRLKKEYAHHGADLWVYHGKPEEVFQKMIKSLKVTCVVTNRDYEPYALERDKAVFELLQHENIEFLGAKDHVIFEKNEVLKDDGEPYKVFTPYANKWKSLITPFYLKPYPVEKHIGNLRKTADISPLFSLADMGFEDKQCVEFPHRKVKEEIIQSYHTTRDIPSIKGTTRMSVHLRFGTISIRDLAQQAYKNEKYLNELIWRDFYQMIIYHFPHTISQSFKLQYDAIPWENNESHFKAWCQGKTGYPIVDAGMRELNETGFMHNRVRMIVASFLTKHLLIDWRWGEAYFAEKLSDFELASNVGGWQWAASSGVDAQPYFRVFNPHSQQEKFDKELKYIKKWVPEYGTKSYPQPIVEHKSARQKAIDTYKKALSD
ncbi:MAG: deoxyribodipyrimidine photo-lyase [Crocinitomicaceae bacterium]|nr:deoxyribodipyrimidine photo-lyase [Crocinitomicaceae bacterium]